MPAETSCGAIIFNKSHGAIKYLLLHYESGHWDFVKGHKENKETDFETVIRETREETGIEDLKFIDGFKERITYFYKTPDGKTSFKQVFFYLAETKTTEVKLSFEHIGYKWLSFEDAYNMVTYKNAKDVLLKAHSFLKTKS
ncbi:MAG: bis(5'-nucleosyl)-tetraphosphatase [Candidatus Woesearchaeota archaeon]